MKANIIKTQFFIIFFKGHIKSNKVYYTKKKIFLLYIFFVNFVLEIHYQPIFKTFRWILKLWQRIIFLKLETTFKIAQKHLCVIERLCDFLTFRFSDLITTFTYVLMDNFRPFFLRNCNTFVSYWKPFMYMKWSWITNLINM